MVKPVQKRNRIVAIDYNMLSSYLGRWATVLVFSAIILLTAGALFLDENDFAHMSITIGVCAFDSARANQSLRDLGDLMREKGAGDVKWRFIPESAEIGGCDFYLMTSIQASRFMAEKRLRCALLASVKEGQRYTRGAVIAKPGAGLSTIELGRVIFTSPVSASGFLSPYLALADACTGGLSGPEIIEFAGVDDGERRVIFGVLFGAYDAGGIGLERFLFLESRGVFRSGELEILLTGEALPEIVLAAESSMDRKMFRVFSRRLAGISERMPHGLRAGLLELGISGFVLPRDEDEQLIIRLESNMPERYITDSVRSARRNRAGIVKGRM